VRYPRGTCAQIRAAKALFNEKNRVEYVACGYGGKAFLWTRNISVRDYNGRLVCSIA
jgi:hypothetical protein